MILLLLVLCLTSFAQGALEEVSEVAVASGFSKVTLVALQKGGMARKTSLQLLRAFHEKNIQTKVLPPWHMMNLKGREILKGNFLIHTVSNEETWLKAQRLASQTRVMSAIVLSDLNITTSGTTNLMTLNLNAHFYLLTNPRGSWLEIILLKDTGHVPIVNSIRPNGIQLRSALNFQGVEVTSSALDWAPYFFFTDCNDLRKNCRLSGLFEKPMTLLQSMLNLTISCNKAPTNSWPSLLNEMIESEENDTNILEFREYTHLSLSVWVKKSAWVDVVDVASMMHSVNFILVSRPPKLDEVDFGLFLRPFSKSLWLSVLLLFLTLVLAMAIILKIHGGNTSKWSFRVALTTTLFLWMTLDAFYSGALTMFFTNEPAVPFQSVEEILEAYPEWKLITIRHSFTTLQTERKKSHLFSQYWQMLQEKPEELSVDSGLEGLTRVNEEMVVLELDELLFKQSRSHALFQGQDFLVLPVGGQSVETGILLPRNSPLSPAIEHVFLHLCENGLMLHTLSAVKVKNREKEDALTILAPGQLIMAYVIIALGIMLALTILLLELCMRAIHF